MWLSAFKSWAKGLVGFLAVAVLFAWGMVSVARADTTTSVAMGVDYWGSPSEPARYLPGYASSNFKSVKPWVRAQIQHRAMSPAGPVVFTVSGQTDPEHKGRVDRLDADLRTGSGAGVRAGILPYRVSWCRADGGPWIAEPDAFCRFSGLKEISEGAFGAQVYRSFVSHGFVLDAMTGVYRPLIDGQNEKLGPYVAVGPTVKHHVHGVSVNAIHLATGIETRAGWTRTAQNQDSDRGTHQRQMRYDSYYLAAQGHIAERIDLRVSLGGYFGSQVNPAAPLDWDGRSRTLELIYKSTHAHTIAAGLSRYTNITTYSTAPNHQRLQVDSLSLAWRADWPVGVSTTVQATRGLDDGTTRRGTQTTRSGTAYGLRVQKVF